MNKINNILDRYIGGEINYLVALKKLVKIVNYCKSKKVRAEATKAIELIKEEEIPRLQRQLRAKIERYNRCIEKDRHTNTIKRAYTKVQDTIILLNILENL